MFKFLQKRREETIRRQRQEVLTACDDLIHFTITSAWQYVSRPRDTSARAELLQKAASAGLAEHDTVKRLDFLQRLLPALAGSMDLQALDAFLAEANHLQMKEGSAVHKLVALADLALMAEQGPRVIDHDQQNSVSELALNFLRAIRRNVWFTVRPRSPMRATRPEVSPT